jgi:acyl carrier protein
MSEIFLDDILKLVGLQLGKRNVTANNRLLEDLNAESVDLINLIVAIEAKYGIAIKESEIARVFTPQDLFELVVKKKVEE